MANDEEAEIRKLIDGWLRASSAGELERVLEMMTEDAIFLAPSRPPIRGRTEFAATQIGMQGSQIEATSEIQEIRVIGDWAYVWTQLEVVMTPSPKESPVKRAGPTLSVLRKKNGQWRMFRDANMLSVLPPSAS
jgi:uncharacterized protein (TIGR02246 family)